MTRLAQGEIFSGKYRLDALLARGGMGSVWTATDVVLGRRVAVKFMDTVLNDSQEARVRFEREARAVAQLQSPHVVQIFDHGVDEDTPYIVMELLQGEDLDARLRRVKRLSLAETSQIVTQVARGLRRAHQAGIVHRDLKPGNIFLARGDDDEDIVKILDFGVAKLPLTAAEATQTGVLVGSVHYMSPEQARGTRVVDARSDLWSLAAIIFRAITGKKAFSGTSLGDVIIQICTEPLPRPCAVAPDLPASVDVFFERAFARSPDDRFQTVRELSEALASEAGVLASSSSSVRSTAPPPSAPSQPGVVMDRGPDYTPEGPTAPSDDEATTGLLAKTPTLESSGTHRGTTLSPDESWDPSTRRGRVRTGVVALAVVALGALVFAGMRESAAPAPATPTSSVASATAAPVPAETTVQAVASAEEAASASAPSTGTSQTPTPPASSATRAKQGAAVSRKDKSRPEASAAAPPAHSTGEKRLEMY